MDRQTLKKTALGQLKNNWGQVILACILQALILGGSSATGIGAFILMGPLEVGLAIFLVKFVINGDTKIENLFKGFNDFMDTFVLGLLHTIFIVLWSLLFVIPGIIKSYSYAACFYIKQACPSMTAQECITKSREIMNGHKGELFVLDLSFIGWWILSTLTAGIGLIWLIPYIQVTKANYFVNLLRENGIMPSNEVDINDAVDVSKDDII